VSLAINFYDLCASILKELQHDIDDKINQLRIDLKTLVFCVRLISSITIDENELIATLLHELKDIVHASEARIEARIKILGQQILRGQNTGSEVHEFLSSSISPPK
jgi:hypothetical protein